VHELAAEDALEFSWATWQPAEFFFPACSQMKAVFFAVAPRSTSAKGCFRGSSFNGVVVLLQKAVMASSPDVLVATPGRIAACIREGSLTVAGLQQGLETLVLDEVRIVRYAPSRDPN
jgi:hypothetical protein